MSSEDEKLIEKLIHQEGVVKQRKNHITYQDIYVTKKVSINDLKELDNLPKLKLNQKQELKPKQKPELKPKQKPELDSSDILDNYKYLETVRNKDERRKSFVKHTRLSTSVEKETTTKKDSYKDYSKNTTYVQKRPKISSYDNQRISKQTQKYSVKTMNQRQNKFERNPKTGQNTSSQRDSRAGHYSSSDTKNQKPTQNARKIEEKRKNKETSSQRPNLPFYPVDKENTYQSKTAQLHVCGNCGKPKRPQEHERLVNTQRMGSSIPKESPQGDYAKRSNAQQGMKQPNISRFQFQEQRAGNQQRIQENLYASKTQFCPVHGYY